MKTYYKVVRRNNHKLFSCAATGKAYVIYKEKKSVRPPEWLWKKDMELHFLKI